jgi:hypothetical protein
LFPGMKLLLSEILNLKNTDPPLKKADSLPGPVGRGTYQRNGIKMKNGEVYVNDLCILELTQDQLNTALNLIGKDKASEIYGIFTEQ